MLVTVVSFSVAALILFWISALRQQRVKRVLEKLLVDGFVFTYSGTHFIHILYSIHNPDRIISVCCCN